MLEKLTIGFVASTHDGAGQNARKAFKFSLDGTTSALEGQRITGGSLAEIKERIKLKYLLIFCIFEITARVLIQQTQH